MGVKKTNKKQTKSQITQWRGYAYEGNSISKTLDHILLHPQVTPRKAEKDILSFKKETNYSLERLSHFGRPKVLLLENDVAKYFLSLRGSIYLTHLPHLNHQWKLGRVKKKLKACRKRNGNKERF